jgi:hypothetical protein
MTCSPNALSRWVSCTWWASPVLAAQCRTTGDSSGAQADGEADINVKTLAPLCRVGLPLAHVFDLPSRTEVGQGLPSAPSDRFKWNLPAIFTGDA